MGTCIGLFSISAMSILIHSGSLYSEIESALVRRVQEVKKVDKCAALTVLVGSNLLAEYLGRLLANKLGGIINVRFMTLLDAAMDIAASDPSFRGKPVDRLVSRLILDDVVEKSGFASIFGPSAHTRGFSRALMRTMDDLSEAGCDSEIAESILNEAAESGTLSDKVRATLSIFSIYRERIEDVGGDSHSLFRAASESRRMPETLGARVFAYGFYDFNEMQYRLLKRIAASTEMEFFFPCGEGEVYRFVRRTISRLERDGARIEKIDRSSADREEKACRSAEKEENSLTCMERIRPVILDLPDEEEEVREIARRILTFVRDSDAQFEEMGILLACPEQYVDLARDLFAESKIPIAGLSLPLVETSACARSASMLLELLRDGVERTGLLDFLSSSPINLPGTPENASDRLALWIRTSADFGMTGEKGWVEENDALIAHLSCSHERESDRSKKIEAAKSVSSLLRAIVAARDSMHRSSSWKELCSILEDLLVKLLLPSDELDETLDVFSPLARLAESDIGCSTERFFKAASEALETAVRLTGRVGSGAVNVLTLAEARGISFGYVFIVGLAERLFPRQVRQDPFLEDAERELLERISRHSIVLSRKSESMNEDALMLILAAGSAREYLFASYPRNEQKTGRARMPSFYLRFIGFDPARPEAPGTPCRIPRGKASERGLELSSEDEFRLESARAARSGNAALPSGLFFECGMRLVRARASNVFTTYDGVLVSSRAAAELRKFLEERRFSFSASALNSWIECPFAYFLQEILRIEPSAEPERELTLSPKQRGSLVHEILAEIYRKFARQDMLPLSGKDAERVLALAQETVRSKLDAFEKTAPVGLEVFWEVERETIATAVQRLIEEELLAREDFVPKLFELSFGGNTSRDEVTFDLGNVTIRFHGRIDRIDEAPDKRFRVIDYKTGKINGKDWDPQGELDVQLPIYLLAASRLLGASIEKGEAFYIAVGRRTGKSKFLSGEQRREWETRFRQLLSCTIRGIENGIFFAPPNDTSCRFCDLDIACKLNSKHSFERKSMRDMKARSFLALREKNEESD